MAGACLKPVDKKAPGLPFLVLPILVWLALHKIYMAWLGNGGAEGRTTRLLQRQLIGDDKEGKSGVLSGKIFHNSRNGICCFTLEKQHTPVSFYT